MEKKMVQVAVRTEKDMIEIFQDDHTSELGNSVFIYPEQVDIIIKWLQEAKAELSGYFEKALEERKPKPGVGH